MATRYWPIVLIAAVPLFLYICFILLCSSHFIQRQFQYAHLFHTQWWHDTNEPEYWGFASPIRREQENQVTPFFLTTPDNERIYAWHVLPLPLYTRHEEELADQPTGVSKNVAQTLNFKLLKGDPNAKLVISLHGNAGHVAQAVRPAVYHAMTDTSSYHVLAIDYRGFGHSTGSPTEEGLILDAAAAVDWALSDAGVRPDRIVLLAHSLGTGVASAVAARYAARGVDFAGVVLVAGFSSFPALLSDYSMAGVVPILRPFKVWPWLLDRVARWLADEWRSDDRLRETVRLVRARRGRLRLTLVHAQNDRNVPCPEDDRLFASAVNGTVDDDDAAAAGGMDPDVLADYRRRRTLNRGRHHSSLAWREGDIEIRQDLFPYGGHNDIMTTSTVVSAVLRSFES